MADIPSIPEKIEQNLYGSFGGISGGFEKSLTPALDLKFGGQIFLREIRLDPGGNFSALNLG